MTKFPNMIEWMDWMTMEELHKLHEEVEGTESFSDFVQAEYEAHKEQWGDDMNQYHEIKIDFNSESNDICEELAKLVLQIIINESAKEGKIRDIILSEEMAPDHTSATMIVDSFWRKIIPAVKKTLNELE